MAVTVNEMIKKLNEIKLAGGGNFVCVYAADDNGDYFEPCYDAHADEMTIALDADPKTLMNAKPSDQFEEMAKGSANAVVLNF
jgi:hypothetical protein